MLVSHHSLKLVRTAHGAHDAHLSHVPPSTRAPKAACVSNRIFHAPKPHHSYKYTVKLAAATTNRAISESTSRAREMEEEKVAAAAAAAAVVVDNAARLRSDFLEVLRSRRSPEVPLTLEQAKPVANPLYQDNTGPQTISEAMESCPRADIKNLKDVMREENFYLTTEEGEQGRLPVLTLSLKDGKERKPAVVFLHSTNKCKEWLRPLLEAYASRGYVAIAVDSRYHGERASNKTTYRDVSTEFC
uniref:Uncharacterized protein LOC105638247 n=1 Tax=Rhizophora mucronata TaxID=61149 RepID=A0A2P2JL14_RHIMU